MGGQCRRQYVVECDVASPIATKQACRLEKSLKWSMSVEGSSRSRSSAVGGWPPQIALAMSGNAPARGSRRYAARSASRPGKLTTLQTFSFST